MSPISGRPLELIGALDPRLDSDDGARAVEDLRLLRDCGVQRVRLPVAWDRVEAEPGVHRWDEVDATMLDLQALGLRPIPELVRDAGYPRWLEGGFADPAFGPAFVRYCEAFARRYPWIEAYTLFDEPFATLFRCGHEGLRPPYGQGMTGLVALFANVLPALAEASRRVADVLPHARHVYVDACEPGDDSCLFVLDLLLGRLDAERPFAREVARAGGEELFELEPGRVDVLGLSRRADSAGAIGRCAQRYALPMILVTNLRGTPAERATWLRRSLEECEAARAAGVALEGLCWAPFVDPPEWNSLLARCDHAGDPIGVYGRDREETEMSRAYRLAAARSDAADLTLPAQELAA